MEISRIITQNINFYPKNSTLTAIIVSYVDHQSLFCLQSDTFAVLKQKKYDLTFNGRR